MNEIIAFYKNNLEVEAFLLYSTSLFIFISIMVFLLTIYSRYSKIRNQHTENEYIPIVENMLMTVLFMEGEYDSLKDNPEYIPLFKKRLPRELIVISIINLHQNYGGVYAEKLEKFYFDSSLVQDSFSKLRNRNWEIKCKGIKELSELNVLGAFDELLKLVDSENRAIQIIAINACIKLDPTRGIAHLAKHKHPIDIWSQLNIIDALKHGNIETVNGIELLLASENVTVVSLGLKIFQSFQLSYLISFVNELIVRTKVDSLKAEAERVVEKLSY
jgi:hypothetical protein